MTLKPFKFWCQKVIPLVYDDSLSYYELLCKVVTYINGLVESNQQLVEGFEELQQFVDNYFENLDVSEEIDAKLDQYVQDGTLSNIINQLLPQNIGNQVALWLDENVPTGETLVVDKSLTIKNAAAESFNTGDRTIGVLNDKLGIVYTGNLVRGGAQVVEGFYDPQTGEPMPNVSGQNYKRDQTFYEIAADQSKYIASFTAFVVFYDKNYVIIRSEGLEPNVSHDIPSGAKYIRWSGNLSPAALAVSRLLLSDTLTLDMSYSFKMPFLDASTDVSELLSPVKVTGNIVNRDKLVNGYIDLTTGNIRYSGSWKHDETYYPLAGNTLFTNRQPFLAFYDANRNFISGIQPEPNTVITPPENAEYVRYSVTDRNPLETELSITIGYDHTVYALNITADGLKADPEQVIVDASGNGDYTSLTEALFHTTKNIFLMPGTYDIVSEYKAFFGDDVFDTLSDATALFNFQYGLYISNRYLKCASGSKIVCDLTNILTVNGSHRFSPINLGRNATLENAFVEATKCFYLIHDDYGANYEYFNLIKDCILIGHDLVNVNIIGGGTRNYSHNIVDGCYCDNGITTNNDTIRYHNYNNANAQPVVIVKNCRVNGSIKANYYGAQTTPKMKFIAHNNSTKFGVLKGQESSSFNNDNVDLYAWANVIEN